MTTNKKQSGPDRSVRDRLRLGRAERGRYAGCAGNDPVTLVAAPNGQFVYVINQGDSTVQEFAVEGDGSLASKNVYKTTGTHPTAVAIDPQGAFLYVTFTYQTGYSATTPGRAVCRSSR